MGALPVMCDAISQDSKSYVTRHDKGSPDVVVYDVLFHDDGGDVSIGIPTMGKWWNASFARYGVGTDKQTTCHTKE